MCSVLGLHGIYTWLVTTVFSESGVDLFLNVRIIGAEDCYRGGPLGRIGLCVGHLGGHEKGHKSNKSCHCWATFNKRWSLIHKNSELARIFFSRSVDGPRGP